MARITATEQDWWEGRTEDTEEIPQHDIDMGHARKCTSCNTNKYLQEMKQCTDTLNWYCNTCINDGTMEESIATWFNESIKEFRELVNKIKIGRTPRRVGINYIK